MPAISFVNPISKNHYVVHVRALINTNTKRLAYAFTFLIYIDVIMPTKIFGNLTQISYTVRTPTHMPVTVVMCLYIYTHT